MVSLDAPLAIVDLETTGGDPASDRITEIAVLEVDNLELTGRCSTLVNPERSIRAEVQALTGISNDMVADAPRFPQLAEELADRLAGRLFVAHNARFDYDHYRILTRHLARRGVRTVSLRA